MTLLNIFFVWIHLIAATFWIGGMLFLSLVAVPLLKQDSDPLTAQRGFINLARRFRKLVWIVLTLLVITGSFLLPTHIDFSASIGEWPPALLIKLSLVVLLIVVSLLHDQVIGPKVRILKNTPTSELVVAEKLLIRLSPLIGRLTMLLGLAILLTAVILVRT
jgi:putative copper export protein